VCNLNETVVCYKCRLRQRFQNGRHSHYPVCIRIHYYCQSGRRWNRGRTKTDYVHPVADDAGNIEKQARQYMYTVILSSVRVDTFAMEKYLSIKYFELVCLYPWILSAPYFIVILWPVRMYEYCV